MSDSEDSTVTYMAVSSPFGGLSDIGSPGVDGPPVMLEDPYAYVVAAFQAPPSPDYVPDPEDPEQAPISLEFVPEPVYPEFMPPKDEVFPAEEQTLPAAASPIADLEEDEEDPKEDPIDYPADEGDLTWMSIRDEPPTPFWYEAEIFRLLVIPSPPPSPLFPWSSPLPQIPSPSFQAAMIQQRTESPSTSHSLPLPPPIILSHTRASVAMIRAVASSTYILASRSETPPLLPISLPTPSPPLLLPSTDRRADMPRPTRDTWDDMVEDMQGTPAVTDVAGLSQRMRTCTVRQDTDEIYLRLDDA
ncbi:hypothetical protein Tco_0520848 [Tanacetum coccineum]